MSIAGIASSSLFQNSVVQQTQNRFQQIQSQFQKLGQDLQSGNLTQAQSDFATLSQELPNGGKSASQLASASSGATSSTSSAATSSSNPILQAFQSLGQDLQSGNLTAAQQDFATIQQSAQQAQACEVRHAPRPPSSSRWRRLQPQLARLHASARLHFTWIGSAIRQSLVRSTGLHIAAIRPSAVLAQLRFLDWLDAEPPTCIIRNPRR